MAASSDPLLSIHDDATGTTWKFERRFLASSWSCIWGVGCQGILDEPAADLGQGCCSVGAELLDEEEAMLVSALAATIDPERFQFHDEALAGVFAPGSGIDGSTWRTRLVDGACVFLNRPGFAGGAGCALHLEAVAGGESPIDWKPSVCWQLPLRVERSAGPDGPTASLRSWRRADWGSGGETMAWCCTEAPDAYVGNEPVVESLADELKALVGVEVYIELRKQLGQ